jgi:hypothetical protein
MDVFRPGRVTLTLRVALNCLCDIAREQVFTSALREGASVAKGSNPAVFPACL